MPELPEVEAARKQAERALVGRRIVEVYVADDPIVLQGVTPTRFIETVRGATVVGTGRKGKHLWLELDRRPWPMFHFGMTGSFVVSDGDADRPRFCKVELVTDHGTRLAMPDARRLGRLRLKDDPGAEPPIGDLGWDPLTDPPTTAQVAGWLAPRRSPIKSLLLDQRFLAGVGNWIADEVLYQAGIAPHRPGSSLSPKEVARLRAALVRVIRKAVSVDADSNRFPRTWLFHHRWGKQHGVTTARGETIQFDTFAGRTAAWVPAAQR